MPQPILPAGEAREALLADHSRLRRLLVELEDLADRVANDTEVVSQFHSVAKQFRRALETHNQAEENVLQPLLRACDSWAPSRAEQMMLEHVAEHGSILAAFDSSETVELSSAVPRMAEDLREHMAKEEGSFLSVEVLREP